MEMTNVVLQESQEKPNFNVFITRENEPNPEGWTEQILSVVRQERNELWN